MTSQRRSLIMEALCATQTGDRGVNKSTLIDFLWGITTGYNHSIEPHKVVTAKQLPINTLSNINFHLESCLRPQRRLGGGERLSSRHSQQSRADRHLQSDKELFQSHKKMDGKCSVFPGDHMPLLRTEGDYGSRPFKRAKSLCSVHFVSGTCLFLFLYISYLGNE